MKQQYKLLVFLVALTALAAILYFYIPGGAMDLTTQFTSEEPLPDIPVWLLAMANAGIVLILYLSTGSIGLWLSKKIELPGVFRPGATWREWLL